MILDLASEYRLTILSTDSVSSVPLMRAVKEYFNIKELGATVMTKEDPKLHVIAFPEVIEEYIHPAKQEAIVHAVIGLSGAAVKLPKGVEKLFSPVCIMTHSDCIFNALRVAVKQGKVPPNDVAILFVENEGKTVHAYQINQDGRLAEWPHNKGFFMEMNDKQLEALLAPRG